MRERERETDRQTDRFPGWRYWGKRHRERENDRKICLLERTDRPIFWPQREWGKGP